RGRAPGTPGPERAAPVAARDGCPRRRRGRTPPEAPAERADQPRDGADARRFRRRSGAGATTGPVRVAPRRVAGDAGRRAGRDAQRGLLIPVPFATGHAGEPGYASAV